MRKAVVLRTILPFGLIRLLSRIRFLFLRSRLQAKHQLLVELSHKLCPQYFIETGTFHGESVSALMYSIPQIHSIELNEQLYGKVKAKFLDFDFIHLHHGDSREILPTILGQLNGSALLWLDAHYSGLGTAGEGDKAPLLKELEIILKSPYSQCIAIDDYDLLKNDPVFPDSTEIKDLIHRFNPLSKMTQYENMLIIHQ